MVMNEWEAVEASTIAHCWFKSTILPHALATEVTALHGVYRASSRELGDDFVSVVSLLGDCRFGQEAFIDTPTSVSEMALQDWLSMGEDEGALAATADESNFVERARCNEKEVEGGGRGERKLV